MTQEEWKELQRKEQEEWKERRRKEREQDKAAKKPVTDALLKKGVKIAVGGCGCCGSPSVTIIIDGETLVNDEEEYNIHMDYYDTGSPEPLGE